MTVGILRRVRIDEDADSLGDGAQLLTKRFIGCEATEGTGAGRSVVPRISRTCRKSRSAYDSRRRLED